MASKVLLQQMLVEKHCCLSPRPCRVEGLGRIQTEEIPDSHQHQDAVDRGTSSTQTISSMYQMECYLACDRVVLHERASLEMCCKLLGFRKSQ